MARLGPLLRVSKAEIQVSTRLSSHLEALGKNPFSKLMQIAGRTQFLAAQG